MTQTLDQLVADAKVDTSNHNWRMSLSKPEMLTFSPDEKWFARMVTNKGTIRIRLFTDTAPMHVTSFAYLIRLGFYDGLIFHRVIPGFMAQGGCPMGSGTGGPGYKFSGEFAPGVKHDRPGLLSMANAGPNTNGSQFFLISGPSGVGLPPQYNHFGQIVKGLEVLDAMEKVPTGFGDRPKTDVVINSVTITVAY